MSYAINNPPSLGDQAWDLLAEVSKCLVCPQVPPSRERDELVRARYLWPATEDCTRWTVTRAGLEALAQRRTATNDLSNAHDGQGKKP